MRLRSSPMGIDILDTHGDRMRHLSLSWWATVETHIPDDDRAFSDAQLRAMVLSDLKSLDEPERGAQPSDGFTDVRVDEDRDDNGRGDGPVLLHGSESLVPREPVGQVVSFRPSPLGRIVIARPEHDRPLGFRAAPSRR